MNADKLIEDEPKPKTYRSELFINSFQIQGLCESIRFSLQAGEGVGDQTILMLKQLRDAIAVPGVGYPVERIPEVLATHSPTDLLSIAEVLRSTYMAFLTPEEAEERRNRMGFHAAAD